MNISVHWTILIILMLMWSMIKRHLQKVRGTVSPPTFQLVHRVLSPGRWVEIRPWVRGVVDLVPILNNWFILYIPGYRLLANFCNLLRLPIAYSEWGPLLALWWMGSPLSTLVNFGEWGPPFHFGEFWWMGSPLSLWWMGSPLCTLVNGVPPLHFGEWGPPSALWWTASSFVLWLILVNGVPPLDFGEWSPPFELWWMGSPLCTLINFGELGPPFSLWWMGFPLWTLGNFGEWGPPFTLWWMGSPLCTLVNGVLLCTLMNGVPPFHFFEWAPPLYFD